MQTKIGWVGKAIVQCLLFPLMFKNACQWQRTKKATGKKTKPQPLSSLCHSCRKSTPAVFRLEKLQSQAWPVNRKVLSWSMKESAYVRDRETRDPLVYKLSLRTPCRWQTLWHVLALLKVAVLLKMGGKVAGTQNLEKGTDMSVFLSAPWFLLTVGKPCCSAPHRPGAPGDMLLSWWSSRGHFFGIGYIKQCPVCGFITAVSCRVQMRLGCFFWGGAQYSESICSNRPRKTIFKISTQRTCTLHSSPPLLLSTLD